MKTRNDFIQKFNALWYLDPHYERLSSRSVHLRQEFRSFCSFNNWQPKKGETAIVADLYDHIQTLSQTMLQSWMNKSEYTSLRQVTEELLEAMHKYKEYLDTKNEDCTQANECEGRVGCARNMYPRPLC